ncbi:hypothetical protein E3U44_06505 [Nitrosococcus wardiae]|uniref:Transposase n=1 Tax=Nitrosococcus wardiae TaxID=1814290 RepID=A0A4P7C061_9GAMM|nr:hypothetical protein E3U44_06505 [Nitrosococcus wardiae]
MMNTEKKASQYTAEFKARAVKLAVESEQPFSKTAEELGVNKNTLPTWIGKYHCAQSVEKKVGEEHLDDELKRGRTHQPYVGGSLDETAGAQEQASASIQGHHPSPSHASCGS